jgi:hypothetical protein
MRGSPEAGWNDISSLLLHFFYKAFHPFPVYFSHAEKEDQRLKIHSPSPGYSAACRELH